jgi:hypothetical protein
MMSRSVFEHRAHTGAGTLDGVDCRTMQLVFALTLRAR